MRERIMRIYGGAAPGGLWRLVPDYLPAIAALLGSLMLLWLSIDLGPGMFISDAALMMLALASYLFAAVFYITDLWAPFSLAPRLAAIAAAFGVFFNLSSWLVRWTAMYERELTVFIREGRGDVPWIFRYIPFANLYDLSLAFAFGAGITTLIVARKPQFRTVAAISMPMAALVLVLARFIGSDMIDLPPVLDSYWRPIHVGVASLSYGIALVCFCVAVLYLIKDGLPVEKIRIWTSLFSLTVLAAVSRASIFAPATFGEYTASIFVAQPIMSLPVRADIPYVGWIFAAAGAALVVTVLGYAAHLGRRSGPFRRIGDIAFVAAAAIHAAGIAMLIYQIRTLDHVVSLIDRGQFTRFGSWMLERQQAGAQTSSMGDQQLYDIANKWITENSSQIQLSLNANPVELAALITALTVMLFAILFGVRTERIRAALPELSVLDSLMYKLGALAFGGLALLLMTGAVWANESWGRYWGWDSKEVGALLAWLAYALFLHSRIAYGWKGRRSAYFAILAFLLIIFTYLGVSYLLPGLHSYA